MSPPHDSTPPEELARQRVPLQRKVSLKFKEFRGFITEYSANISLGGMFIHSDIPQSPGTRFDFELSLEDDFTLIQGIGEVVWVRHRAEGPKRPPGMGIRFLHLEPESERLILKIVEEHVESGGTPFDLEQEAFGPGPATEPVTSADVDPTSKTGSLGWGKLGPGRVTYAPGLGGATSQSTQGPQGGKPSPEGRNAGSEPPFGGRVEDLMTGHFGGASFPQAAPVDETSEGLDPRTTAPTREERLPAGIEEVARIFARPGDDPAPAPGVLGASRLAPVEATRPTLPGDDPEAPHRLGPPSPPAGHGMRSEGEAAGHGELPPFEAGRLPPLPGPPARSPQAGRPAPGSQPPARPALRQPPPPPPQPLPWGEQGPDPYDPDGHEAHAGLGYGSPSKRRSRARPLTWAAGLLVLLAGAAAYLAYSERLPLPEPLASWLPGREAPQALVAQGEDDPMIARAHREGVGVLEAEPDQRSTVEPSMGPSSVVSDQPGPGSPLPAGERPPSEPSPERDVAPAAPTPEPVSRARLTRLENVHWEPREGGTLLVLVADGGFNDGTFSRFRLGGELPREVVRIRGVQQPFDRAAIRVGTREVAQVRTGLHAGNELHVVLDLAAPGVILERTEAQGNRLLLYLSGGA
jgi:uncharacterized protein (TIGR02266 family)